MDNFNKLINSDKPVLVDFFADWCGPCKMLAPELVSLKEKVGDSMSIVKINVDKNQQLATHFQVRGVPTMILFKSGEILWRQSGYMNADQLQGTLAQHIS